MRYLPHPAHPPRPAMLPAIWATAWPPLLVAALVIVALQPRDFAQPLPVAALLPLLALHRLTTATRLSLTAPFAVLAGLTMDALSSAPLGYWALINLAAVALAASSADAIRHGPLTHAVLILAHLAALCLLQWVLIFACTFSPPGMIALIRQAIGAAMLYPFLLLLLPLPPGKPRLIDGAWQ